MDKWIVVMSYGYMEFDVLEFDNEVDAIACYDSNRESVLYVAKVIKEG